MKNHKYLFQYSLAYLDFIIISPFLNDWTEKFYYNLYVFHLGCPR